MRAPMNIKIQGKTVTRMLNAENKQIKIQVNHIQAKKSY